MGHGSPLVFSTQYLLLTVVFDEAWSLELYGKKTARVCGGGVVCFVIVRVYVVCLVPCV
jgi:hypothetical protein